MPHQTVKTLLKTYGLAVSVFFIFRLILFFSQLNAAAEEDFLTIVQAFVMGIRFDIVVSGYILSLPAVLMFIFEIIHLQSKRINSILFYLIFILFTITFGICAADIPYFMQFNDRFSIGAFEWFDNIGFVFSMIIQEPKYFLIALPYLLLVLVFFYFLKRIFKKHTHYSTHNLYLQIPTALLFLGLMFVGIRGRIEKKSPIRTGTAYFCDNAFLNKLGLNPMFTLMRSYLDTLDKDYEEVHLMPKDEAYRKIKEYLQIKQILGNSPIARQISADTTTSNPPNVIIIIMESMSAGKMQRYGNTQNLTPFMDSLANHSVYFDNYYTAGKHTFNGIFSTLHSFPALYRQHTMRKINEYHGIAAVLAKHGYSTTYFTTHDSQFDNIGGFLRANGFQNIISQADYPSKEIKTTLGVPDDYMFRFSIPVLNELAQKESPFFVTFMTASDHGPYYIPEYFTPKQKNIKQQVTEYADWSLKQFIKLARKQTWFDNTLIVFTADHGAALNTTYDLSLNYFHCPLIFYAPKLLKNKVYARTASQIDVFPTILGLLQKDYINNTLGIDLFREERPYAIINDDDKIGILDSTFLCIMKENGKKLDLYKYRNKDKTNYIKQYPEKAKEMADYAKTCMQVHQEMLKDKSISLKQEFKTK